MTEPVRIQRPYVLLSVATSLDGFIDDASSDRLLLSNAEDFDRVDEVRASVDAILLGAGAIRADNPRVVVQSEPRRAARLAAGKPEHPHKVTITGTGHLDPGLRWFSTGGERLVYTTDHGAARLVPSVGRTASVVSLGPTIDLADLLDDLGQRGVGRVMVEGGEQLNTGLLAAGLVDEVHVAIAPLLVGEGPRFVSSRRFPWATDTRWKLAGTETLGDVVVLQYLLDVPRRHDLFWLERAIDLADRCPPSDTAFSVGAYIVAEDGTELASGYSRETDEHVHAEEAALAKLAPNQSLAGATMYSSLEPCGARASRPTPCAKLIIGRGIRRVVMAWSEPSDFVDAPNGLSALESAGVDVITLPVGRKQNYRR